MYVGGSFVTAGEISAQHIARWNGTSWSPVGSGFDGSVISEFMAYDPNFRGGVTVATGDINGDGRADVITGAGPGIMQAGHEGAGPERSFGANIRLPWEQSANPIIQHDKKLITFKYFFTRKLTFVRHSGGA